MVEGGALEEALPRVLAVSHVLDVLQVLVAVRDGVAQVAMQRIEPLLGGLDAGAGIGVRGKPLGQLAPAGLLAHPLQRLEHVRHLAHVIVLVERVAEPRLIRLVLRVAAVLEQD